MGGSAVTSLWFTLPCVIVLGFSSADQEIITANSGDTAILPCQKANNIKVVEWSRPDLNPECVILYRNKQFDPLSQNPAFKNRAKLQMEDGNVTLTLEKVTTDDSGKYECRILTNRKKRAVEPIRIVTLSVVDPPGPHRHLGVVAGIVVFVMTGALMTVMALRIKKEESPPPSSPDKGTELPLV